MAGENIALGFGGNVDYEIEWDSAVFENLIARYRIRDGEIGGTVEVRDTRSLLLSILGFMRSGSGGEVFAENVKLLEDFSKLFKYKITLGGTNVRAAIALAKLGRASRIHALERNEHTRRLLPRGGSIIWADDRERFSPHLIVQFAGGTELNAAGLRLRAERSNRIIYVNNPQRLEMKINFAFFDNPGEIDAWLISGFNSVHDRDIIVRRMEDLARALSALPPGSRTLFEDGCYHVHEFTALIQKALCPHLEVYSLNEDEFGNYMGAKIALLDPAEVFSLLPRLGEMIPVPAIAVHAKYWALVYGKGAEKYRPCLRGGIRLAATRFRYGDDIGPERYREISARAKDPQGALFSEEIERLGKGSVCCEASLDVPEAGATTIGLGDAFVGGFIAAMASEGKTKGPSA